MCVRFVSTSCTEGEKDFLRSFLQEVEREKSFVKLGEELEQLAATKEILLKVLASQP